MQLGRGVRRDHDPVLLGQRCHAQPLRETRGARAVELHVADLAPVAMKSRTVKRVSPRSPCARGYQGGAEASRTKSAGCKYQCSGSSSQ